METADSPGGPITLYTSRWCGQSILVERFFADNHIPATVINVDEDPAGREELVAINDGYASVPTVVFADGSHLTEPSIGEIREKLGMGHPGLVEKLRGLTRRPGQ
jgi:mycoredoxin